MNNRMYLLPTNCLLQEGEGWEVRDIPPRWLLSKPKYSAPPPFYKRLFKYKKKTPAKGA